MAKLSLPGVASGGIDIRVAIPRCADMMNGLRNPDIVWPRGMVA